MIREFVEELLSCRASRSIASEQRQWARSTGGPPEELEKRRSRVEELWRSAGVAIREEELWKLECRMKIENG